MQIIKFTKTIDIEIAPEYYSMLDDTITDSAKVQPHSHIFESGQSADNPFWDLPEEPLPIELPIQEPWKKSLRRRLHKQAKISINFIGDMVLLATPETIDLGLIWHHPTNDCNGIPILENLSQEEYSVLFSYSDQSEESSNCNRFYSTYGCRLHFPTVPSGKRHTNCGVVGTKVILRMPCKRKSARITKFNQPEIFLHTCRNAKFTRSNKMRALRSLKLYKNKIFEEHRTKQAAMGDFQQYVKNLMPTDLKEDMLDYGVIASSIVGAIASTVSLVRGTTPVSSSISLGAHLLSLAIVIFKKYLQKQDLSDATSIATELFERFDFSHEEEEIVEKPKFDGCYSFTDHELLLETKKIQKEQVETCVENLRNKIKKFEEIEKTAEARIDKLQEKIEESRSTEQLADSVIEHDKNQTQTIVDADMLEFAMSVYKESQSIESKRFILEHTTYELICADAHSHDDTCVEFMLYGGPIEPKVQAQLLECFRLMSVLGHFPNEEEWTTLKLVLEDQPQKQIDPGQFLRGGAAILCFVVSLSLVLVGYKTVPQFDTISKATHFMHTIWIKGGCVLSDMYTKISHYIMGDETIDQAKDHVLHGFIEDITRLYQTPSIDLVRMPHRTANFTNLIARARKELSTCGKTGSVHMKTSLMRILEHADKKVTELTNLIKTNLTRPTPVCHLIYGNKGIGKTHANIHMCNSIRQLDYPDDAGVYCFQDSDFYVEYAGQRTAYKQEAFNKLDLSQDKFSKDINSITSEAFFNLEGAYAKFQPCEFATIFIDTNTSFQNIYKGLPVTREAAAASFDRFTLWEAVWASDEQFLERSRGQREYQPDYSHIQYIPYRVKSNKTSQCAFEPCEITIAKIVDGNVVTYNKSKCTVEDVMQYDANLRSINYKNARQHMDHTISLCEKLDRSFGMDLFAPLHKKEVNSNHLVVNITGPTGSGKTEHIIKPLTNYYERTFQMGPPVFVTNQNILTLLDNMHMERIPKMYVFDDFVKRMEDGNIDMKNANYYCDMYDRAPSGCIFVFVSNIQKQLSYNFTMAGLKPTWVNKRLFKDESKYRRMGYTGYFPGELGNVFIPETSIELRVENFSIYDRQMNVLHENQVVDMVFSAWQKYLQSIGTLIMTEVVNLPTLTDYPVIMHFKTVESCRSIVKSPQRIMIHLINGTSSTSDIFHVDPSIRDEVAKIPLQELSYPGTIEKPEDLLEAGKFYMKVFRKHGVHLQASLKVEGEIEGLIDGVRGYYTFPRKNAGGATRVRYENNSIYVNYDTENGRKQIVVPLHDYYSWFIEKRRTAPEYLELDHHVIPTLQLEVLKTFITREQRIVLDFDIARMRVETASAQRALRIKSGIIKVATYIKEHKLLFTIIGIVTLATTYFLTKSKNEKQTNEEYLMGLSPKEKAYLVSLLKDVNGTELIKKESVGQIVKTQETPTEEVSATKTEAKGGASYDDNAVVKVSPSKMNDRLPIIKPSDLRVTARDKDVGDWADDIDVFDWNPEYEFFKPESCSKQMLKYADVNERDATTLEKIYTNMVIPNLVQCDNPATGKCFGIGIVGKVILANKHMVKDMSCRILIKDDRHPSPVTAKPIFLHPTQDLALLLVTDPKFPSFKKITSHFYPDYQHAQMGKRVVFAKQVRNSTAYNFAFVLNQYSDTTGDTYKDADGSVERVVRVQHTDVLDAVSGPGDCGSVYLDPRAAHFGQPCIMGIHMAGSTDPKHGRTYCALVTQKLLAYMLQEGLKTSPIETPQQESVTPHVLIEGNIMTVQKEKITIDPMVANMIKTFKSDKKPHMIFPDGDIKILGVGNGMCQLPKTNLVPTWYSDMATECGIKSMKKPAQQWWNLPKEQLPNLTLDSDGRPCQMASQIMLYNEPKPNAPQKAVDYIVKLMTPAFTRQYGRFLQKVPLRVALNGIHENETEQTFWGEMVVDGFGPLVVDSSCGATLKLLFGITKKSDVISIDLETGERRFKDNDPGKYLRTAYNNAMRVMGKGYRPWAAFKTSLKQEALVKTWKPRTFEAADLLLVLLERTFLGLWIAANYSGSYDWACRMGTCPYRDFNGLAQHHLKKQCHACIDFKRWDKNVPLTLFEMFKGILTQSHETFLKSKHPTSCTWCASIKVLCTMLSQSFHVTANMLLYIGHGVKSGCASTTPLNSLFVDLILFSCYCNIFKERTHSFEDYKTIIYRSSYGDDLFYSCDEPVMERFSPAILGPLIKRLFGIEIDTMQKDGKEVNYTKDIEEISFISRKFTRLDGYNTYIGSLKKESINTRCHYISLKHSTTEEACDLLNTAYYEAALWDREYFGNYQKLFSKLAKINTYFQENLSYLEQKEIHRLFHSSIITRKNTFKLKETSLKQLKLNKMASLNIVRSWPSSVVAINEIKQSGWITKIADSSTINPITWTVEATFVKGGVIQTKTITHTGPSKAVAKEAAYTELLSFAKNNVFLKPTSDEPQSLREILAKSKMILQSKQLAITPIPVDDIIRHKPMKPIGIMHKYDFTGTQFTLTGNMDEDYNNALQSHYALQDHHPECSETMTDFATLHCLCDLLACAFRVEGQTVQSALLMILNWVETEKFSKLSPTATSQFFLRFMKMNLSKEVHMTHKLLAQAFRRPHTPTEFQSFCKSYENFVTGECLTIDGWEDFYYGYMHETSAHIVCVENLMLSLFGLDVLHDDDKYLPSMILPYVWNWGFKPHIQQESTQRQVMPKQEPQFVTGDITSNELGTGTGPQQAPIAMGIIPGPSQSLMTDSRIDAPGVNFSGLVTLNPNSTIPDFSGAAQHNTVLANFYSLPQKVTDFEISDKSAAGDHIGTLSLDPNVLPDELKAWLGRHTFVNLDMTHKITIHSSQGIVGTVELVANPMGLPPAGNWLALRSNNQYVTLSTDAITSTTVRSFDTFNSMRMRKLKTMISKTGVVTVGLEGDDPIPTYELYVSSRIENKWKDGYSILARVQSWFGPEMMAIQPNPLVALYLKSTATQPDTLTHSDLRMPQDISPVSLYVQTTNRTATLKLSAFDAYPSVLGLQPDSYQWTSQPNVFYSLPCCIPIRGKNTIPVIWNGVLFCTSGALPQGVVKLVTDKIISTITDYGIVTEEGGWTPLKFFEKIINDSYISELYKYAPRTVSPIILNESLKNLPKYEKEVINDLIDYKEEGRSNNSFVIRPTSAGEIQAYAISLSTTTTSGYIYMLYPKGTYKLLSQKINAVNSEKTWQIGQYTGTYTGNEKFVSFVNLDDNNILGRETWYYSGYILKDALLKTEQPPTGSSDPFSGLKHNRVPRCVIYDPKIPKNIAKYTDIEPLITGHKLYTPPTFVVENVRTQPLRDPRFSSIRFTTTHYSAWKAEDLEQIPYDDYAGKVHNAFSDYAKRNGLTSFKCTLTLANEAIATLHFNTTTGLGMAPTDQWKVLTNLETRLLGLRNITDDATNVETTNTSRWSSFIVPPQEPTTRQMWAVVGGAVQGLGSGIGSAYMADYYKKLTQAQQLHQRDIVRMQGDIGLMGINAQGEISQKLLRQKQEHAERLAGLQSPGLRASGSYASSVFSGYSDNSIAKAPLLDTPSSSRRTSDAMSTSSLGSLDSTPLLPRVAQRDNKLPSAEGGFANLRHIPGISVPPGTKLKDVKFPEMPSTSDA